MLPIHATFCANCGERVDRQAISSSARDHTSFAERYRITSLARRGPYVQISFAIDTRNLRPVVVRDIDISSLTQDASGQALAAARAEYDLLCRQNIPDLTPLIDLRSTRYHLYTIAGWPFPAQTIANRSTSGNTPHFLLYTLQDLLQSGIGLPDEQVALSWAYRLCRALEGLHEQHIIIGDLDPYAIIVSGDSYRGLPALAVSWLPDAIRDLFAYSARIVNTSRFSAPEVYDGTIEPCSDLYSLGAILYLLLTGTSPEDARERSRSALRSPREYNADVSSAANALVMRALSLDPAKRFQSAGDLAQALFQLTNATQTSFPGKIIANLASSLAHPAAPTKAEQRPLLPTQGQASAEMHADKYISSVAEDNKIEEHEKPQSDSATGDEVTVSIAPIQAALARKHQSRIAPGRQGTHEKQGGEIAVEKEQPQQSEEEQALLEEGQTYEASEERAATGTKRAQWPPEEREALETGKGKDPLIGQAGTVVERQQEADQARGKEQRENDSHETTLDQEDAHSATSSEQVAEQALEEDEEDEETEEEVASAEARGNIAGRFKQLFDVSRVRRSGSQWGRAIFNSFLRFILGEQRRVTSAAAIIETPMRVQPNQNYALRIHITGRNEPGKGSQVGLSALVEGKTVHIEVRSALYKNYAYVVQQADVRIPARGYAAEVTIPMHALSQGKGGRRERLQIILMDEQRRQLYERPFIIELFISPLVHSGQEGHNVLTIPL